MSTWEHSPHDTQALRGTDALSPEATVYRKDDLVAVIFCGEDGGEMCWHLYVSGGKRTPTHHEVLEARQMLLPNIEDFWIARPQWLQHTVHLAELRPHDEPERPS